MDGIIPGPGYPVALRVKYISFDRLLIPVSNWILLYIILQEISIVK